MSLQGSESAQIGKKEDGFVKSPSVPPVAGEPFTGSEKVREDMAKDCRGLTVQSETFVHGRGPVFWASMPHADETLKGRGANGAGEKQRLASALWDHFAAGEGPFGKRFQSSNRVASPIRVVRGLLGRPHLLLDEGRGPAISFSEGGGKIWAALCGDESDIGIDVTEADEFPREYPFHRVFHPPELQQALQLTGGDLGKASALLWSIKEAVVKAMGCAFHLVDPRQIGVYPPVLEGGGYAFPVGLSGKALARFPKAAGRSLWAFSLPQGKMWLSIALWGWPSSMR
jgi:hypothetical protein